MAAEKTILLVEDNPDDAALALRAFKKNEIRDKVIVLKDGTEVIDYLFGESAETQATPHMILLDLKLPKIDGLEVLRRIRENEKTKLIVVVVLSSSAEPHDVRTSYGLGANSYVRKAVDFNQFTGMVKDIWNYWFNLNQIPTVPFLL